MDTAAGETGVQLATAVNRVLRTAMDDIFSGEEQTETTEVLVTEDTGGEPETIGQARDETGRFAPKETGVDEPQVTAETVPPTDQHGLPKDVYEPLKAVRNENQELKSKLAALEASMQSLRSPPEPAPSIWEDEQGWEQNFGGQVVNQAVQQATFNAKLDMSEMMVRQSQPDFDEVKADFLRLAEDNPILRKQALDDPHPWNKAYQIAKNHKAMQELGATDVATLEAKIEERIRAEYSAKQAAPQVTLPQSLAGGQGLKGGSGAAWSPPTLEDIIGR